MGLIMISGSLSQGTEPPLKKFKSEGIKINSFLAIAIETLYKSAGFTIDRIYEEEESKEYGAYRFQLDCSHVVFRVAKTTPTKIGQFVTLWKRPEIGTTASNKPKPLHFQDNIDFVVIHTWSESLNGQFIFPTSVLVEKGIITGENSKGKTAFRVYPPWTSPVAKQAVRTQKWQQHYFVDLEAVERTKKLFETG